MNMLDGKSLSQDILTQLKTEVSHLSLPPSMAVVLVGDDPASHLYVGLKERAAGEVGIAFRKILLPAETSSETIRAIIGELNADPSIHGILVQLPLPRLLEPETDDIIMAMDPHKDIDGFHPENVERLLSGETDMLLSPFPRAVVSLLRATGEALPGKQATIVCNSTEFGTVMREVLRREGVRSQILLSQELSVDAEELKNADIVVTACGIAHLVEGDMVKDGAIVIDGGTVKMADGKVCGDIDRASFEGKPGWLSPVPGGVGPMTVASLLNNVVRAAKK